MKPAVEDILAMVPPLIDIGKSIFDAIRSAASGDAEMTMHHSKRAHDLLTLEIAKRELK